MKVIKYSWLEKANRGQLKRKQRKLQRKLAKLWGAVNLFREYSMVSPELVENFILTYTNHNLISTVRHTKNGRQQLKDYKWYTEQVNDNLKFSIYYSYVFSGDAYGHRKSRYPDIKQAIEEVSKRYLIKTEDERKEA